MAEFHKLTIKEIKKETADAVSIIFDVPDKLKSDYKFTAGQYLNIKKELNGKEVRRAYSICSDPNTDILKIVVKAVEGGTFSVYATTLLHQGDKLEVSTPEGRFTLNPIGGENYIGIAAGSGITPIMSMIKASLHDDSTFTLIYGNKSTNDTIFRERLEVLKKIYSTRLNVHYVFSREETKGALFGRCDAGNINYFLRNEYKNISFDKAFLCGPESMIKEATSTLIDNNISKSVLLLAAHQLKTELINSSYFPAYELVHDDLRDYRFYAKDMAHPSDEAVEYVWEFFKKTYWDHEIFELDKKIESILNALQHRPLHPENKAHQVFIESVKKKIKDLQNDNPFLDFGKEQKSV